MEPEYINLEDHGEWFNFRMEGPTGQTFPVKVSREVMEDFYGASGGSLVQAFVQHEQAIRAKVLSKFDPDAVYTRLNPLELRTTDF
ncbi:MAG: hypothetical protein JSR41_07680 [Proteobacteria bacterium]|nr:hypothetical protein [Pseudomonadota bacterium]